MAGTPSPYTPDRVKHLEMLQAVIGRMANEAALVRGWALTVTAAFYGFAAKSLNWRIAAVGFLPVVLFWWLNVYYLWSEQKYRCLYGRAADPSSTVPLFSMDASQEDAPVWKAVASRVVWPFYSVMVLVGVVLIIASVCSN